MLSLRPPFFRRWSPDCLTYAWASAKPTASLIFPAVTLQRSSPFTLAVTPVSSTPLALPDGFLFPTKFLENVGGPASPLFETLPSRSRLPDIEAFDADL